MSSKLDVLSCLPNNKGYGITKAERFFDNSRSQWKLNKTERVMSHLLANDQTIIKYIKSKICAFITLLWIQ